MVFKFGRFVVDIDVDKTKDFYEQSKQTLTEGCECIGCQNFVKASEKFSPEIHSFFSQLGVDICKAPDMSAMYGERERQILHYCGFYHLCGTIIDSVDTHGADDLEMHAVTPDCHIYFNDQWCALVEQGFPAPIIQMEVEIEVPWILEEQHYLLTSQTGGSSEPPVLYSITRTCTISPTYRS